MWGVYNLKHLHLPHNNCRKASYIHIARDDLQRRDLFKPAQYLRSHLDQLPLSAFAPNPPPTSHPTSTLPIVTHTPSTTSEGMCQHFHIWGDKQTIQGLCPNCIWRDKQNQEKGLVLESKTGKPKRILHKNFLLDFFQTYTSRRVAYLCIFLYVCIVYWIEVN